MMLLKENVKEILWLKEKEFRRISQNLSRTKQAFKQECDINHIMKKFKKVAGSEFLNQYQGYLGGQFGDFSEVVDYRTALDQINRSKAVFEALPSVLRKRFDNDPAKFLDFVQDPNNSKELVEMGLAVSKEDIKAAQKREQEGTPV